jgi:hypothetical protein
MISIDSSTIVARSGQLLYSTVDGDVTMMSVDTGNYYSLTAVGARIWLLLEQPQSAAEVCNRLMKEYRVERGRCEHEVLGVFQKMIDEGVLIIAAAEAQIGSKP